MPCYFFKFTPETGSPLYLDDEPIKWDAVQITLERDPEWHGVNYEYTDGDVSLEFDCLSGRDFIEQIYQSQGGDGYIGFQFGYYDGVSEIIDYSGKLNLYTRKWVDYRISASLERSNVHDLIKTRWETKIDMTATESIDGVTITPPTLIPLELHSKTLRNEYNKKIGIEGDYAKSQFLDESKNVVYYVFNTIPDTSNGASIVNTIGSNMGPTPLNPVDSQLALWFDLKSSGQFTFNIKDIWFGITVKLLKKLISREPYIGAWTLTAWLDTTDANGVVLTHKNVASVSGTQEDQELNSQMLHGSLLDYVLNLNFGDRVYLYAEFSFDGHRAGWKGIETGMINVSLDLNVVAQTFTQPSEANVLLTFEALEQSLAVISGQSGLLISDFYGRTDIGYAADGCGALKAKTNGFQIRRFAPANNPIKLSLQEQMKSENAIFCIGMGYEAGKVRIEDRGYFYQDQEIIHLGDIGEYGEEVAKELTYSGADVGYSKYLDEGEQLLDQFSTQHQRTTPIKSNENKLPLLAEVITSGEAIETTRRYQYDETPKDSTKYDDDGFMISVIRDGGGYATEKDAAFAVVTGINDPSTAYNLRHTPHRNFLNWAKWINGGLYYKNGGDIIKNTFVKQNGELVTQLNPADPCPLGDVNYDLIKEGNDDYLTMYGDNEHYFIPEWLSFKTGLEMASIRLIRNCMTGQDTGGRNYGYITYTAPNGDTVQAWLYRMVYNPNTELCQFRLLKKKVLPLVPIPPFDCVMYADYTFADFEAIPDLSPEIEQCRFFNFN